MTVWDDRTLLEDLLASGVDDWVYAAEVYGIAARSGLPGECLRLLAIGLIADALADGLVVAGEYDGERHRPWDCTAGEAILRIAHEWQAWGDAPPTPGAIVWLELTKSGRVIGEAVLERESS